MQNQAHLVREWFAATGAVGGKLALVEFDQVLRLAAGAVNGRIEPCRRTAAQVGDHVADV